MAENEGDWYTEGMPKWILKYIREVDVAAEHLVTAVAQLRIAVEGIALGAAVEREAAQVH